MPALIRLFLRHVVWGLALGAGFTSLLLWLDVAGIGHLVGAMREGPLAVLMLVVFNTIVFSGVQFAWAVMSLAEGGEDGPKGPGVAHAQPQPVAARAGDGNRSDRAGWNFPRA